MKTLTAAVALVALFSLSPATAGPEHKDLADTGHPLIGEPPAPMDWRTPSLAASAPPAATKDGIAVEPAAPPILLSSLLGLPVFDTDDNALGDVADLVLAEGAVATIVVRVGGLFGVGWKDVAVPIDDMTRTTGPDGTLRVVVKTAD